MKPSLKIPPDFREIAPKLRVVNAMQRWGISENTAYAWYRRCGIEPARMSMKGIPKSRTDSNDRPEQIEMCLNCTRAKCPGTCEAVRLAAGRKS